MATVSDARFDALRSQGHTGSISDMTLQWLKAGGATSDQLSDAWFEWLVAKGATPPFQRNDAWFAYLGTQGHTGALNDRELAYWLDQIVP